MKAAFTYASSLNAKEETQANPLKIEDFEPKAAAAPAKEKAAEAAPDGGPPANTTAPAKDAPAKEAPAKTAPAKEAAGTGKKDAPKGDSGCCVIA